MAKKKEEAKIILERVYNVPLRKEWLKAPRYKRTKKAMKALHTFLDKHMKTKGVKIGKYLNLFIFKHGMKNPPHIVKVSVTKDSEGFAKAELVGAPKEEAKKDEKKPSATKKEKKEKPAAAEKTDKEEMLEEEFQKQKEKIKKTAVIPEEKVAEAPEVLE